jgi:cell division septation protein DedD
MPARKQEPAEPAMFVVRSGALPAESDKSRRVDALRTAGYHPIVKKETTPEGGEYFVIELGRFWDMELAVDLLAKIKPFDSDFFIVATQANIAGGETLTGDRLSKIFPYEGEDSLDLLKKQVSKPKPLVAVATNEEGNERLIVRRLIRPEDKGSAKPTQDLQVTVGRGAKTGGESANPRSDLAPGGPVFAVHQPQQVAKGAAPVSDVLRQAAWNMRENGFDVYLEDEKKAGPEGVLVGIFEQKDEALGLADELKSYGYAVSVIQQEDADGKYQVFADVKNTSADISVITPEGLSQYKGTKGFNPPADSASDTLLELSQPRTIGRQ